MTSDKGGLIISESEFTVVNRDQLYALVWAKPMSHIARDLGVSDVGLAKLCRRMNIPRPPQGFWARPAERRGKASPLPEISVGIPTEHRLQVRRRCDAKAAIPTVNVPRRLARPTLVTKKIMEALKGASVDYMSALQSPGGFREFPVKVSAASERRAIRILVATIKALESRGHHVALDRDDAKLRLAVTIEGQRVFFRIREYLKRSSREQGSSASLYAPSYDYAPSGRLILETEGYIGEGRQTCWSDTKRLRVEERVGQFVVGIEAVAEVLRKRAEKWEGRRLEEEQRLAHEERRRIAEAEAQQVERLRQLAMAWKEAQVMREFLDAVEGLASGDSASAVARGREIVAALDPLDRYLNGSADLAAELIQD